MNNSPVSFGSSLRGQIREISYYVEEGIQSLHQVKDFAKERNNIERDYAQKLESLVKRYKARSLYKAVIDVSEDESASTCSAAWSALIDHVELVAKAHSQHVNDVNMSVINTLKATAARKDDSRKKHAAFSEELIAERDRTYADKEKAKQYYDEACVEVEKCQAKLNKNGGDLDKFNKQLEHALVECSNRKNNYVLSLAIANVSKAKYFEEDVSSLADQLQTLDESRILAFQDILRTYINLETTVLFEAKLPLALVENISADSDARAFVHSRESVHETDLEFDSSLFGFVPWNGGSGAGAETILDRDSDLSISEAAVIILNNKLIKDRKHLDVIGDELSRLSHNMLQLKEDIESLSDKVSPKYDETMDRLMEVMRRITLLSSEKVRVKSEMDTIIQSIGDSGIQAPIHDFKPSSFAMPVPCDFCRSKIWGTSKQGLKCKVCNYCCHTKCEMNVLPNCSKIPGVKNTSKTMYKPSSTPAIICTKRTMEDQHSANSSNIPNKIGMEYQALEQPVSDPTPEPSSYDDRKNSIEQTLTQATVLYTFEAKHAGELSICENDELTICDQSDSSGWLMAHNKDGASGLVPADYVAIIETVRARYDFEAVNNYELELRKGDVITVIKEENLGWLEGRLNGRTGIFPASYVEAFKH